MSQKIGFAAEALARDYLVENGLRWVESNYRCRLGEIDLIMRDGDYLVFIEVRSRESAQFGGALASVTRGKQLKIMRTAQLYLLVSKWQDKLPIRFDVLSVEGIPPSIKWVKNAFGTDY